MKELTRIAEEYAAEKINEVMTIAIAEAYADGYRDGYKDGEEAIPVNLRGNKTEYVDLGLPSGTLWAKEYETLEGEILYLPYEDASKYQLPTETQWGELLEVCRWESNIAYNKWVCIGPNGNFITFYSHGYKTSDEKKELNRIYFWIYNQNDNQNKDKKAIYMVITHNQHGAIIEDRKIDNNVYPGYKLPIRLVRN